MNVPPLKKAFCIVRSPEMWARRRSSIWNNRRPRAHFPPRPRTFFRSSPPSSLRTGMFCRFGSVDDSLPVGRHGHLKIRVNPAVRRDDFEQSVGVCGFQFCDLPVINDFPDDRVFALEVFQHVDVGEYPVFVFFGAGSISFSKRIAPSCFGELMLNGSPPVRKYFSQAWMPLLPAYCRIPSGRSCRRGTPRAPFRPERCTAAIRSAKKARSCRRFAAAPPVFLSADKRPWPARAGHHLTGRFQYGKLAVLVSSAVRFVSAVLLCNAAEPVIVLRGERR